MSAIKLFCTVLISCIAANWFGLSQSFADSPVPAASNSKQPTRGNWVQRTSDVYDLADPSGNTHIFDPCVSPKTPYPTVSITIDEGFFRSGSDLQVTAAHQVVDGGCLKTALGNSVSLCTYFWEWTEHDYLLRLYSDSNCSVLQKAVKGLMNDKIEIGAGDIYDHVLHVKDQITQKYLINWNEAEDEGMKKNVTEYHYYSSTCYSDCHLTPGKFCKFGCFVDGNGYIHVHSTHDDCLNNANPSIIAISYDSVSKWGNIYYSAAVTAVYDSPDFLSRCKVIDEASGSSVDSGDISLNKCEEDPMKNGYMKIIDAKNGKIHVTYYFDAGCSSTDVSSVLSPVEVTNSESVTVYNLRKNSNEFYPIKVKFSCYFIA